jgi:hypothetical protein
MAAQTPPYVLQSAAHSAELFRRELMSGLPSGSAGGVVPATVVTGQANPGDLQVSAPTSGMSVLVAPGQAIVPGTLGSGAGYGMPIGYGYPQITLNGASVPTLKTAATQVQLTTQGAYYCYNDNSTGKVPLTIAAANASNPRIDVVGIQVSDSQYSGSTNSWALTVVTGTAAASPVVPTFPANFLPLALVWVPAAASNIVAADIVDLRVSFNRNPYRARLTRATNQSLPAGVFTQVQFDTVTYDVAGMTTGLGTSTAGLTAPVSGYYSVSAGVQLGGEPTAGELITQILVGATDISATRMSAVNTFACAVVSDIAYVGAGQEISVSAYQSSTGAMNIIQITFLATHLLSPA